MSEKEPSTLSHEKGEKEGKPLAVLPPPSEEEAPEVKPTTKLETLVKRWEEEYKREKANEIAELHNALVETIANHKPHLSTVLTALEIVRHELITEKLKQIEAGKPVAEAMG